ncbi:MAG: hypothetical protein KGM99_12775, partial [Burkholderiales bacterium]|nr:hypothetical protein [Burkholderiales bacterium]
HHRSDAHDGQTYQAAIGSKETDQDTCKSVTTQCSNHARTQKCDKEQQRDGQEFDCILQK